MTLRVLYVCTGNVCRSPTAELLFRSQVTSDADVVVSSAGVSALVGQQIDGSSAQTLRELGIDPDRHRARQFDEHMALAADLVLTAERAHRDEIMEQVPAAFRRTFTMVEFARVAYSLAEPDPATLIARAASRRGMYGALPARVDDIADPYQCAVEVARRTTARIMDTVTVAVAALGLARSVPAIGPVHHRPSPRPHSPGAPPSPGPCSVPSDLRTDPPIARRPRPHRSQ